MGRIRVTVDISDLDGHRKKAMAEREAEPEDMDSDYTAGAMLWDATKGASDNPILALAHAAWNAAQDDNVYVDDEDKHLVQKLGEAAEAYVAYWWRLTTTEEEPASRALN